MKSGRSSLSFTKTVIRRKLIDYVRKEQRHDGNILISSFDTKDEEEGTTNPLEIYEAMKRYEANKRIEERQFEIQELNRQLSSFEISFLDLAEASPKHHDSRIMLCKMGKCLAEDKAMVHILLQKNKLPIKELL